MRSGGEAEMAEPAGEGALEQLVGDGRRSSLGEDEQAQRDALAKVRALYKRQQRSSPLAPYRAS